MNRHMKFRAWDPGKREMLYIGKFKLRHEPDNVLNAGEFDIDGEYIEFHLMQFTGLTDKNGKEIYEGDIYKSGNGRIWEIRFGKYIYCHGTQMEESPCIGWHLNSKYGNIPISNTGLVIGNIHQHAHLLNN